MTRHPSQPRRLLNTKCVYCGEAFGPRTLKTKEHVIGRKFVPRGSLQREWNLILNACARCNNLKADLENDLSVITMLPPLGEQLPTTFADEVARRATRASSRRTGLPVSESRENAQIEVAVASGVTFKFNMTAPPQMDSERVATLSLMQMQAFFYMISYSHESNLGGYWRGKFNVADSAGKVDWGNIRQRSFARRVQSWPHRFWTVTANGHFKAVIRRKPHIEMWAWALEWNNNLRNIGFFGNEEALRSELSLLPHVPMEEMRNESGHVLRFRSEVRLPEHEDVLFSLEGEPAR